MVSFHSIAEALPVITGKPSAGPMLDPQANFWAVPKAAIPFCVSLAGLVDQKLHDDTIPPFAVKLAMSSVHADF